MRVAVRGEKQVDDQEEAHAGISSAHRRVEPTKIEIRLKPGGRAPCARTTLSLKASLIGARRSRSLTISTALPCLHDQAEIGALPRSQAGTSASSPCVRVSRRQRQDVILCSTTGF